MSSARHSPTVAGPDLVGAVPDRADGVWTTRAVGTPSGKPGKNGARRALGALGGMGPPPGKCGSAGGFARPEIAACTALRRTSWAL
ncbi:hypothetical protein [Frankia tisae]|uniref:hypothetical protein n=1 Tax=Frankia tisae TaxID=2950104 RepID=UPI0021BFF548|nr:hypothetical protein [Frankia tisae]